MRMAGNDIPVTVNRGFETKNAFCSQVATSEDTDPHPLWGTETDPARTSGKKTQIYTIMVYSHSGEAGTVAIEVDGKEKCPKIPVDDATLTVLDLPTPIPVGDNDVNYHASAANMDIQILGLEVA